MKPELQKILSVAQSKRKENKQFLKRLSKQKPDGLDKKFATETEHFFNEHSCLDCANCCKTTSPIFRNVDIERLAARLKIKSGEFVAKYLHIDEDGHYVLNHAPCPFLGSDNYCSVYDVRPQACREYPHTQRKNIHQIMDLTFRNTLVCPAVAAIVERMKED
ncbi:MAG: YkgJ family cysteine cluster protein [Bacteroidetes bacterium]|nr:YkgJ family cysteine cluster protein [Bacteroidota bacterium]